MKTKLSMILVLMLGAVSVSGCVPVAIGAGAAIGADAIAEERGSNLF
ncbi:MAG: hypothetical protein ACR2OY_05895 [Boseongicola sp.]